MPTDPGPSDSRRPDPRSPDLGSPDLGRTDTAQVIVVEAPAPKRRRRRWIGVLIGLVILAALLVVGFFVADRFARQYATDYVRDRIVEVLKIDPATPVEVDLGEGSVLLQAARGALDQVDVQVDSLTFGELTGSASISARTVPLDSSKPVEKLGIVLSVTEANVRKLSGFISGVDLDSIELGNGLIRLGTDFEVLFVTIPVAVDLAPSADDGGISFEPKTIVLGDQEISVADLRASPQFRALAGDLLNSRDFCVASYLPEALTIDDVTVVGSDLVVSIDGDGTALSDPALAALGVCPAGTG